MFTFNGRIPFLALFIIPMTLLGQSVNIFEASLKSDIKWDERTVVMIMPAVISSVSKQECNSCSKDFVNIESLEIDTVDQEKNVKSFPKNMISLKMGADDPWFGVTYERFLNPYIGAEVQIGLIGASLGAKFYYPGTRSGKVNFYAGALPGFGFMGGLKTYFPIGINLLTKKNFRISLDAGPRIWHDPDEKNFLGFSLKIGKGF